MKRDKENNIDDLKRQLVIGFGWHSLKKKKASGRDEKACTCIRN